MGAGVGDDGPVRDVPLPPRPDVVLTGARGGGGGRVPVHGPGERAHDLTAPPPPRPVVGAWDVGRRKGAPVPDARLPSSPPVVLHRGGGPRAPDPDSRDCSPRTRGGGLPLRPRRRRGRGERRAPLAVAAEGAGFEAGGYGDLPIHSRRAGEGGYDWELCVNGNRRTCRGHVAGPDQGKFCDARTMKGNCAVWLDLDY